LFKYQSSVDKKVGFNIEVGPVVSLLAAAASNVSTSLNFDAVYDLPNGNSLLLTQNYINGHLTSGNTVANQMQTDYSHGLYVGSAYHSSGSGGTVAYNIGVGGLLRLGGVYRISHHASLLFGIYAVLIDNAHTASSYFTPVGAQTNFESTTNPIQYQSFLRGLSSALTTQIGVNLGIQVRFGKKKD
jgi:hypothetical protein